MTLFANLYFFRPICLPWLLPYFGYCLTLDTVLLCSMHPQRLAKTAGVYLNRFYTVNPLLYIYLQHYIVLCILYLTLFSVLCLICPITGFYKDLHSSCMIMPFAYQGCIGNVLGTVKSRLGNILQLDAALSGLSLVVLCICNRRQKFV